MGRVGCAHCSNILNKKDTVSLPLDSAPRDNGSPKNWNFSRRLVLREGKASEKRSLSLGDSHSSHSTDGEHLEGATGVETDDGATDDGGWGCSLISGARILLKLTSGP